MLAKRIVPCLDVKDGRTVKGVNFVGLRDAGDPIELASKYAREGADELVFLDITATVEKRKTITELASRVGKEINIPFTIGGGIASVEDAYGALYAGADKVAINSAAVRNPNLIEDLAKRFGEQCVVVAIDAKEVHGNWQVYLSGGRVPTELELFSWAKEIENRGAGEILFTSMNHDGTKGGFANKALNKLSSCVSLPIIASGGAGEKQHFLDAFVEGNADAALAASVFHYNEIPIPELKEFLRKNGVVAR